MRLEALELLHRPRDGAHQVADVQLHDFVAGAVAGVRDVDEHARRFVAADRRLLQPRRAERELRVAQAEAEREERRDVVEQVAAAGRRLVVVERRQVTDRARNRDRQLAAGIDVAEQRRRRRPGRSPGRGTSTRRSPRTFSARLRIDSGRPLNTKATIGLPVAAIASTSSSCRPTMSRLVRSPR